MLQLLVIIFGDYNMEYSKKDKIYFIFKVILTEIFVMYMCKFQN